MSNYAVATFAIGKDYQSYALTLADSFLLFNKEKNIKFYIISNTKMILEKKYQQQINLIFDEQLFTGEEVLLNKLYVDKHIDEENILLIDADSLICKPLKPLFYLLRNEKVAVWGFEKHTYDHWKGDITEICDQHSISTLYGVNGCLYYFKKNNQTKSFFELCQNMAKDYDLNKLPRVYNNLKDDEIIVSLACAILSIPVLASNSAIKAEKMYYSRKHINLFAGRCKLYYNNFEFEQNNIFLGNIANPIIFCLDRRTTAQIDYRLTAYFLRYFLDAKFLLRIFIMLIYTIIINTNYFIKNTKWNIANIKNA